MTKEDKKTLLYEICARLPFGVYCKKGEKVRKIIGVNFADKYPIVVDNGDYIPNNYLVDEIKLLLRPMNDMTEDELHEWAYGVIREGASEKMRWIYEHGFDYNYLIDKGLAEKFVKS